MRNIVVTLLSEKPSEISRFLKKYYEKDIIIEEGAFKWSCFYDRPLDTINIISTLIDNNDSYKIDAILTLNRLGSIKITDDNLNEIIRMFLWA